MISWPWTVTGSVPCSNIFDGVLILKIDYMTLVASGIIFDDTPLQQTIYVYLSRKHNTYVDNTLHENHIFVKYNSDINGTILLFSVTIKYQSKIHKIASD